MVTMCEQRITTQCVCRSSLKSQGNTWVVYIYCSIGTFLSERTMRGTMGSELGRDLWWIMKGKRSISRNTRKRPYHNRQYGNSS